jgi:hypothetical protein
VKFEDDGLHMVTKIVNYIFIFFIYFYLIFCINYLGQDYDYTLGTSLDCATICHNKNAWNVLLKVLA